MDAWGLRGTADVRPRVEACRAHTLAFSPMQVDWRRERAACRGAGGRRMTEITQLLVRAREGEPGCMADVFATLYPELLRMARARLSGPEATLTPTVLVHEAYLRLTGGAELSLNDRRHFFACAARAMRSIVVDAARRRSAQKRGGGERELTLTERLAPSADRDVEVLSLDQALEQMRARRPRQVEIVELHYFAGFGFAEIGALLECSERTAKREWERARAFLHARLSSEP